MKKLSHITFLLFLVSGTIFSQHKLSHSLVGSTSDAVLSPRSMLAFPDTIKVLAVMVQFQADTDIRTTGNGQFDLSTPQNPVIDSPPHNRQYFEDHLTFLSNYYRRSSKGKVIIQSTIIDSVYTLPTVMATYSPPKAGPNTAVGNLARDTWQMVDASGRVSDFSRYNSFMLFHAGAGRDIDLVGSLGYDPTPLDIPSLYLGLNAFKEFFGTNYQGIPVNGGVFHITNTLVIPETESRTIPATPTNIPLNLSINGLLCASIGNFLGLPDLFDTNTGKSGIGRFGLMDGQAIFSFSGLLDSAGGDRKSVV